MALTVEPLALAGVYLVHRPRFADDRGWFEEMWSGPKFEAADISETFVQDNVSFSKSAGTLRGLHCQLPPFAQGKLVHVLTGAIRDVVVDARQGSTTFGQHVAVELDSETPSALWCPVGFLHGFVTLSDDTRVLYKVTAPYSRDHDRSIAWNDPDLGIDWGVDAPVLSDKDAAAGPLSEAGVLFPEGSYS